MSKMPDHSVNVLGAGRHLRLMERKGWEFVERPGVNGIVVIAGMTARGGVVLVSQWREAVGAYVVEFPAGLAGDLPGSRDEKLKEAAQREFLEETGFEAQSMVPMLAGPPSPGISNEQVTFFRADGLRRTQRGGGVDNEAVRTHVVPFRRLAEWLDRMRGLGAQVDPKVLAGAWLLTTDGGRFAHG